MIAFASFHLSRLCTRSDRSQHLGQSNCQLLSVLDCGDRYAARLPADPLRFLRCRRFYGVRHPWPDWWLDTYVGANTIGSRVTITEANIIVTRGSASGSWSRHSPKDSREQESASVDITEACHPVGLPCGMEKGFAMWYTPWPLLNTLTATTRRTKDSRVYLKRYSKENNKTIELL